MVREVRNCRRCGRIFVSAGASICEECVRKEEEQYAKVRRYLDENPRAGVRETSDATGVPAEMVMEFVRQGLLVSSGGTSSNQVFCAICGKEISSGRVCPKCEAALVSATGQSPDRVARGDKPHSRMYSMDMISRRRS